MHGTASADSPIPCASGTGRNAHESAHGAASGQSNEHRNIGPSGQRCQLLRELRPQRLRASPGPRGLMRQPSRRARRLVPTVARLVPAEHLESSSVAEDFARPTRRKRSIGLGELCNRGQPCGAGVGRASPRFWRSERRNCNRKARFRFSEIRDWIRTSIPPGPKPGALPMSYANQRLFVAVTQRDSARAPSWDRWALYAVTADSDRNGSGSAQHPAHIHTDRKTAGPQPQKRHGLSLPASGPLRAPGGIRGRPVGNRTPPSVDGRRPGITQSVKRDQPAPRSDRIRSFDAHLSGPLVCAIASLSSCLVPAQDLNPQPPHYKCGALPIELARHLPALSLRTARRRSSLGPLGWRQRDGSLERFEGVSPSGSRRAADSRALP